jgi:hypothetical protein
MTRRTPGRRAAALASIRPIRARADVERDELHVEDVLEVDVRDVLLSPGDALDATDAGGRLPDGHCGATLGVGWSTIDRRFRERPCAPVPARLRSRQHGLEDLLIAAHRQ